MNTSLNSLRLSLIIITCLSLLGDVMLLPPSVRAQQTAATTGGLQQWEDTFEGNTLDAAKWESFALTGDAARVQVEHGQVKLRGTESSRAGIRSKQTFDGDRFIVEATLEQGNAPQPTGLAVLALLFDDAGKSRIEWRLTGDNKLEAYDYTNGKSEKLETLQPGGRATSAKLGLARRGDDFYFTLNDQIELQHAIPGVPKAFRIMLYGFGASENDWTSTHVVVQKVSSASATAAATTASAAGSNASAANVWSEDFNGDNLDTTKWEPYTFEGGGGVKIEVKNGQLRQRGSGESRSGIRTKETFTSNDFYVEATVNKPSERTPQPGQNGLQPGFAVLTVLFNGTAFKRIEWIMTSDGLLEAWATINDRMERLDNKKLATREKMPKLGIARRGDKILFLLNRQVGLERSIPSLPSDFKVMLYGFGTTQNDWDNVLVQTTK